MGVGKVPELPATTATRMAFASPVRHAAEMHYEWTSPSPSPMVMFRCLSGALLGVHDVDRAGCRHLLPQWHDSVTAMTTRLIMAAQWSAAEK